MTPADREDLDLQQLRMPPGLIGTSANTRPPRHKSGERFLKGPIPWAWLEHAGQLPGRALHVGLAIWQLAGMRKSATVAFPLSRAAGLGVPLRAARRALRALEQAGLVSTAAKSGQAHRVTLQMPKSS